MKRGLAITAATLALIGGAVAVPASAQAATPPPYKAICITANSHGATSSDWHGKDPRKCGGEYRLYKLNSNSASLIADILPKDKGSFVQAAKGSVKQLDDWCSAHSFQCAVGTGILFAVINPVLSAMKG